MSSKSSSTLLAIGAARIFGAVLCMAFGTDVPAQGQRAPAPAQPAATSRPADTSGNLLSGDKPFSLTVDETEGVVNYKFGDGNELQGFVAKRGVIISSDELAINSDQADYDALASELVASGQRVIVRMGELVATCQLFRYSPKTQEGILTGNPVVYNRTKDGQVSTITARRFTFFQVNGKTQFKQEGGTMNSGAAPVTPGATVPVVATNPPGAGTAGARPLTVPSVAPGQAAGSAVARTAPTSADGRIDPTSAADLQSYAKRPVNR